MAETFVTCEHCGEVQSSGVARCAKCGDSLETSEQRKVRLAGQEQSRREAEHNDVSIHRFPGFGTNGTPRPFGEMSHQLRRRYIVAAVIAGLAFAFILIH
jgi:uncharacterized membrane protein YvbJ